MLYPTYYELWKSFFGSYLLSWYPPNLGANKLVVRLWPQTKDNDKRYISYKGGKLTYIYHWGKTILLN